MDFKIFNSWLQEVEYCGISSTSLEEGGGGGRGGGACEFPGSEQVSWDGIVSTAWVYR